MAFTIPVVPVKEAYSPCEAYLLGYGRDAALVRVLFIVESIEVEGFGGIFQGFFAVDIAGRLVLRHTLKNT